MKTIVLKICLLFLVMSLVIGLAACDDTETKAPETTKESAVEKAVVMPAEPDVTPAEPSIPKEVAETVTEAAEATTEIVTEAAEVTAGTVTEAAEAVVEATSDVVEQAAQAVSETTADVVEVIAETKPAVDEVKAVEDVKMVPLPIVLPKPMFVGTPQNLQIPNLQKPLGKPRPPFYAPEGTFNVAANKLIASSDEEPVIGELEMVTDGDKEASDGSYVELGPFEQYVTIDLGEQYEIYAVLFWHFHKQARVYFDVVVQLSDDPDFVTNVKTIFNNDIDNSLGLGLGSDMHFVETSEGKLVDAKGRPARYVRLNSNGNNANELNHYIEVEVYGKPVE